MEKKHVRAQSGLPIPPPSDLAAELRDVRQRLALARARAYILSTALKEQKSEASADAVLVLQRGISDELDRQIERLEFFAVYFEKGGS